MGQIMGLSYDVSYTVVFRFEDEDEEDIRDKDLLSERLADIMHEWLSDGGYPHPDDIIVELTE